MRKGRQATGGVLNRRGFLGLIGGLPFAMQLDLAEWQRVILPYRMLIKMKDRYIQAPGVKQAQYNLKAMCWDFKAEEVKIHQPLTSIGAVLLDPKGRVLGEGNFSSWVPVRRGDGLIVTYSLGAPLDMPLEEVVNHYKKCWRKS